VAEEEKCSYGIAHLFSLHPLHNLIVRKLCQTEEKKKLVEWITEATVGSLSSILSAAY
jgi:hypothetical protein